MDDILVSRKYIKERLLKLPRHFQAIITIWFTMKISKCTFLQKKIEFVGLEIDEREITRGKRKLTAAENYVRSKNESKIQQFIRLVGFIRK